MRRHPALTGTRWENVWNPSDREGAIHSWPVDDLFDHVDTASCPCRPTVDYAAGTRVLIVHHAWDGRDGDAPIRH